MNKDGNMIRSSKSPYSYVVVDSSIESSFAKKLEESKNIIRYAKLPSWFKIATPLGNYNPDWAVLVKPNLSENEEKLYFIVETKGSIFEDDRRETENLKIECGKKHFEAINENNKDKVIYEVAKTHKDLESFGIKYSKK